MSNNKKIAAFCKKHGITGAQFSGQEKIGDGRWLAHAATYPEGFSPRVGGYLYLTGTPIRKLPDNLTVGGSLDHDGLPPGEICKVKPIPAGTALSWQNGKYILADGIFSEVASRRGNIFRVKNTGKAGIQYLVTDGNGKWAHGDTPEAAKADLIYKISVRDTGGFSHLTLDSVVSFEEAVEAYRVITGACEAGTRCFVESQPERKESYSIREIVSLTEGKYGNREFAQFFAR